MTITEAVAELQIDRELITQELNKAAQERHLKSPEDKAATKSLLDKGHEILPIIEDCVKDPVLFSEWVSALAGPEELPLLLRMVTSPDTLDASYATAGINFVVTLQRVVTEIRLINGMNPELEKIAEEVAYVLQGSIKDEIVRTRLAYVLAATGTPRAHDFIDNHPDLIGNAKQATLTEITEELAVANALTPPRNTFGIPVEESKEDQIETHQEPARSLRALAQTDTIIAREFRNEDATVTPALKLALFNQFHRAEGPGDIQEVISKLHRLCKMEQYFANEDSPIPTIGTEVEYPRSNLTEAKLLVLDSIGIPNYPEQRGTNLWEVNQRFSYSALVQARVLQELMVFGALPLEENTEGLFSTERMPEDMRISLHLNFGAPKGIETLDVLEFGEDLEFLTEILTYAYSSPERLLTRKTHNALKVREAHTDKTKKTEAGTIPGRIELRALELKDFPSYRMLLEAQMLCALMFAYVKSEKAKPLSQAESDMAQQWRELRTSGLQELRRYTKKPMLFDKDPVEAARVLDETDLGIVCREICRSGYFRAKEALELDTEEV